MNGINFISRNGIKALVALVGIGVVGIVAARSLAASPSKSTEADSRPLNTPNNAKNRKIEARSRKARRTAWRRHPACPPRN